MNVEEKRLRASDQIFHRFKYYMPILMRWGKPIYTNRIKYAATDGPHLFLNPEFIEKLKISGVMNVLLHEAFHVFLRHHLRFAEYESAREWNVAADLAGNDVMWPHFDKTDETVTGMMLLPGRNEFVSYPKGKDAEFYQKMVEASRPKSKPQDKPQPSGQGQGQPEEGDEAEGEDGESQDSQNSTPSNDSGSASGDEAPEPSRSAGTSENTNSAEEEAAIEKLIQRVEKAGNSDHPGDERTDLPESFGDVIPHPAFDEEGKEAEEALAEAKQEWKRQVAQGINVAKQSGNLPGWIEEIANEMFVSTKSKQDWRAILRRWANVIVPMGGQSFARPNRRSSWRRDVIIPAKRSRQASKGGLLLDTSGSMSDQQLKLVFPEIEAILLSAQRCEVVMYQADTRLIEESKRTFQRYDFPLTVPPTWFGRGGTNLVGAIQQIAKDRSIKWLIIISDLEHGTVPTVDPGIPTIWIWTPRSAAETEPTMRPTYGTFVGPVVAEA